MQGTWEATSRSQIGERNQKYPFRSSVKLAISSPWVLPSGHQSSVPLVKALCRRHVLITVLTSLYLYCPLPNKAIFQGFSVVSASRQGVEGQQDQEFIHGAPECPIFPAFLGLPMALCAYFLQIWAPHFTRLTGSICRISRTSIFSQPSFEGRGLRKTAPIRQWGCVGHHHLKSLGQGFCVAVRKPKQGRRSIQWGRQVFLL